MRVVLAEDGALLREGLAEVLRRTGFDVTAAVSDAAGLSAAVDADPPDLVLTDVRMPPDYSDEGIRAALELRARHPGLPVAVLSQYVEPLHADKLLASDGGRAFGYLLKDRVGDVVSFAHSLRTVATGGTVVDPEVVRRLVHQSDPVARLSPREREVLALIAEGHSNAAMAGRLFLSEAAIAKNIGGIFAKLDIPSSADSNRRVLAVLAYLRSGSGAGSA